MSLQDVFVTIKDASIPAGVEELIWTAKARADRHVREKNRPSGFVPSDATAMFLTLRELANSHLLKGNSFCEWGSGLGAVTCLAATLGLDATGIEIESSLIRGARKLASDFSSDAKFVEGSFVPTAKRAFADEAFEDNLGRYPWLKSDSNDAYQEMKRGVETFDVVFAYPWPGEEYFIEQLFQADSAHGALLLTYGDSSVRVKRKLTTCDSGSVQRCDALDN